MIGRCGSIQRAKRLVASVIRALPTRVFGGRGAHALAHVWICCGLLCLCALPRETGTLPGETASSRAAVNNSEEEADRALQRAAVAALGEREGTVVAMDPQTGRIRAVVNSQLAFTEALPPGSTIKVFTLLAALRAGLIDDQSRPFFCPGVYKRGGFEINCSHPKTRPPFDPAQALAYSCNYYFSRLGEGLTADAFNATLSSFGFGARTGAGDIREEAAGTLPRSGSSSGSLPVNSALGEGGHVLVTPIQLLTAYAALVNGGHLYVPRHAAPRDFKPHERARLEVAAGERALLLKGMRGAIAYGTATRAGLNSLPHYIFGKTGTATPQDHFRPHGWFVGFASDRGSGAPPSPAQNSLALVVFLKRGQGSHCAELARRVFEEYAHAEKTSGARRAPTTLAREEESSEAQARAPGASAEPLVSVRLTREDATRTLALDDYVFGVLAAEASVENELEALKAQAVISRTYALKNLRRHARDHYDLCNSTHCQRYISVRDESLRADFYELLRRAIRETAGEVLRDGGGRLADAYFSAACGGMTANISSLWGTAAAPSHLRGRRDDYCASALQHNWTDTITAAQLNRALRADLRTDVGAHLRDVRIVKRDATGRAELIALEGERRRVVRGWDFKIIAGRTLGWDTLKSTRFEVARAGGEFVFRGTGFGHGLGLCQSGAHVMASRGASYRQILMQYLPGTSLDSGARSVERSAVGEPEGRAARGTLEEGEISTSHHSSRVEDSVFEMAKASRIAFRPAAFTRRVMAGATAPSFTAFVPERAAAAPPRRPPVLVPRLTLTSEHFRASYTARTPRRDVEAALRTLEEARADLSQRLASAALKLPDRAVKVELLIHDTTGDFVGVTGQPPWAAAVTTGRRIESQPLGVLRRRGVLTSALRHEYAHAVIEMLGRGRTPRWLAEGLAVHVAGEGPLLLRFEQKNAPPRAEIERQLSQIASTPEEMRSLYAAAYREVSALIRREGESSLWRRVAGK